MTRRIGLYVHFPFCARKCAYCDFASFAGREKDMAAYGDHLIQEMEARACPDAEIATLYLGGGTPSIFPAREMARVLTALRERFHFRPDAECSCECNPGTVTEEFLSALKSNGINRLSFGCQAAQERLLRLLGRIHTWEQVIASVEMARKAGFSNINLDLMLGLPTQTLSDVRDTLDKALALAPTHLSCYGLIVEEGTLMHKMVSDGVWQLPDEEAEREMYDLCRDTLSRHGFVQYEISNFAVPGFACRHNVDCWQRKEYLGLGSAACGFMGNIRYQNPPSLDAYLAGEAAKETVLSPGDQRFESVMLGLRMTEGLSEKAFEKMHGMTLDQAFPGKMEKPIRQGLLVRQNGFLRLTRRGMDVQNRVLVEFL